MQGVRTLASIATVVGLLLVSPAHFLNSGVAHADEPPKAPAEKAAPEKPAADAELDAPSTSEELAFLALVNKERAARNMRELTLDPLLVRVGRLHSREMAEKNYFDHKSPTPDQRTPMDRYLKQLGKRPGYACVGENLYYCVAVNIQRGHDALMNSPTHRENILFEPFRQMGVGIYKNAKGEFWVTQMFLSTEDPQSTAQSKNNKMARK